MQTYPATIELIKFLFFIAFFAVGVRFLYLHTKILQKSVYAIAGFFVILQKLASRYVVQTLVIKTRKLDSNHPRQVFYRIKFTLAIFFLNVYTFIFTSDQGDLNSAVLASRGFSYENFMHHQWFILFTSNFVHFHLLHLAVNMLMLLMVTGGLEILSGSIFTACVYLLSMNANVPNGIILLPILKFFFPPAWRETIQYVDVGASLGIIGTLGGLARFMVQPIRSGILILSIVGASTGVFYVHNVFGIDHAAAALLGYGIAAFLLRRRAKKI